MILRKILKKIYFNVIVSSKRLNLFSTLYVNFSQFRFKEAIKTPVLIYGKCKIVSLKGKISFEMPCKKGLLVIGRTDPVRSLDCVSVLNIKGTLKLKGKVEIRRGIHAQIDKDAELALGENAFLGDCITLICKKNISIGKNSCIGNNCTLMDTDFHYMVNLKSKSVHNATLPIEIGDNCWIAGYNVVKKGAKLPEGTIVAGPYSMVGKDYSTIIEHYSIIGGCPAKLIREGYRRIFNNKVQKMLHEHFSSSEDSFVFSDDVNLDLICTQEL